MAVNAAASRAGIAVHNSLKPGTPVHFEPKQEDTVTWYSCGPTVYDLSHMGHARNYVSTDVIRRILRDYFGYKVQFIMNITDVDDKIIIKARRKRLLDLEREKTYTAEQRHALGSAAFQAYAAANLPLLLTGYAGPVGLSEAIYAERRDAVYGAVLAGGTLTGEGRAGDAEAKTKMHVANMDSAARGLQSGTVFEAAEEVLLPYLDSLYKETIDTSDQTMFTDLTQAMEKAFTDDMDALNVLRPDAVTRVTEYVPQIVAFTKGIIDKGFAYEANGSVYFDIEAFERAGNTYARLRPESKNDKALQEEGEGSLSKSLAGKRRAGDFALWKRSKPGEPFWASPWGAGRPGWHIECSVMASDKLGEQMDIHSGGIDLAFPHHDNELAQSEAFFHRPGAGEHSWVRYFLHMGHLSIAGSKMSKSLKNFQTIQDALETGYTARSMRIVFMLSRWNDGLEVSPDMRKQASSWENTLDNFFTNIKARLAETRTGTMTSKVQSLSLQDGLTAELEQAQQDLDAALRNSFDTPGAMQVILRVVRSANVAMSEAGADLGPVEAVAHWVTKVVGIFGLDANAQPPYEGRVGWGPANPTKTTAGQDVDPKTAVQPYATTYAKVRAEVTGLVEAAGGSLAEVQALLQAQEPEAEFAALADSQEQNVEWLALPYLRAISGLRDTLRREAAATGAETKQQVLALSDRIRDYDMAELGVQLDDQPERPSLIKIVPAARLVAAREEKAAAAAEKARLKAEAQRARDQAEADKWLRAKVTPQALFRSSEAYGAWDADGLPTKLADGSDVPKTQQKRLKKEWDRQKKLHDSYVENIQKKRNNNAQITADQDPTAGPVLHDGKTGSSCQPQPAATTLLVSPQHLSISSPCGSDGLSDSRLRICPRPRSACLATRSTAVYVMNTDCWHMRCGSVLAAV
ncbi:cysteinyl-tRNA synthetase [Grosmannia clavigera kw1407]|uniref:cysteine--tRNA ligase n=1 Tax=Grosmannia clavigera (strain kw1407 / UAMH 11150) TaxID=655863 RepID=F0XTV8_GROCL|nr:cysteinyl-tRNA synthetase [Grosmannia clavigera kw1407]EFW98465.1 cysteinyl-tRNA synthetase [Grosmannia clavigera kw1407]